ncbi:MULTISPECIES: amino acid ABC transporter ATP-binding protein [Brevibacterium]|uniref:amino acid ABC transporter ATP-binding protein n=1 Tax=Brevibacterium TaxID=1696 RepID=UPI0024828FC2|nr:MULTISPECIES: amino acid ABC transporter ATP-binding protein [Brevibacterium]
METQRGLVEIYSTTKSFHGNTVLKDVSMYVKPGSVTALIGPSGSGKSTLLRCINGLEPIDSGVLKVNGEHVGVVERSDGFYSLNRKKRALQRVTVGLVFQHFNLFDNFTALENVAIAPIQVLKRSKSEAYKTARSYLDRVGMLERADHYPSQLSGGQQQRVAIARCMTMKPDVLLFDEPTSALDPELVGEVLDVIRKVSASGKTMVLSTHEIGFARQIADQVVFLDEGRVCEAGPVEQVLDDPREPRTQKFLERVFG